jgi:Helix-turn-helix domain
VSVQAMVWVFEYSRSWGLNKLVLLSLANRHNLERKACWPSRSTIAADCGIHEATVKRCLVHLVKLGEVSIEERPRESGPHESNFYRLPLVEKWLAEGRTQHPRGAQSAPPRGAHSTNEGCTQHPEPVIEPVRKKNLRTLSRPNSSSCGNSAKAGAALPQQRRFAIVKRLTDAAREILEKKPDCSDGDLAEELKTWAARNNVPYFDAWPGAATPISQAITNAREQRRKTA